jgi:hypothetical protein
LVTQKSVRVVNLRSMAMALLALAALILAALAAGWISSQSSTGARTSAQVARSFPYGPADRHAEELGLQPAPDPAPRSIHGPF